MSSCKGPDHQPGNSGQIKGRGVAHTLDAHELSEFERGTSHLSEFADEAFEVGFAHEERSPLRC